MKAVVRIMEDMDMDKEQEIEEKKKHSLKQKQLIEELLAEKQQRSEEQSGVNTPTYTTSITRRIINPNKLGAIELRKQVTTQIMGELAQKLRDIDEMPITEHMQALMGGSSIKDDTMRAMRLVCVDQFAPVVEKALREEFHEFY